MNTVKHVMDHRNRGRISVHIRQKGEWVLFTFRDDGPGYPEEVLQLECSNVGFDLIQRIVKTNLGGEVSLYNEGGAVALITFKNSVEVDKEGRG
jgi:two-component sensor histidine kinase